MLLGNEKIYWPELDYYSNSRCMNKGNISSNSKPHCWLAHSISNQSIILRVSKDSAMAEKGEPTKTTGKLVTNIWTKLGNHKGQLHLVCRNNSLDNIKRWMILNNQQRCHRVYQLLQIKESKWVICLNRVWVIFLYYALCQSRMALKCYIGVLVVHNQHLQIEEGE